jgi:hypothetical protein
MGGDQVVHRLSSVKTESTVTKICRSVLPGISLAESTPLPSFPDGKASSGAEQTGLAFLCFQF